MQSLAKLKHALAVHRTGSVTAAADSIGSTQSTITKSIAALEDEIGFALFHRHARGMDITEKGNEYLTRASRIMADFDELAADVTSDMKERNALLRLGITPASLQGLHNPAIRTLVLAHPNVRVHLHATSPERGITLLQRGDIDLLVGPLRPIKSRGDFELKRLDDARPRFFVRKNHPLTKCDSIGSDELLRYPIVSPDLTSSEASDLHEVFHRQGISQPERHLHIIDYFPLVAEMVEAGDTVGVVSEEYARSIRFNQRFEVLPLGFIKPYQLCIAWRKRWEPSPTMRAFLGILRS